MYRLRRLYIDGLGVPDNRFYDVTLDLSGATGDPIDSIVWLRNGAGKTTMLALLLALILPDRRDFLAHRVKGRTLEDLVLSADTGHVAAEWVDPTGGVLLTGAVYEWMGRTRPREHNSAEARSRFRRCWWCVTPDQAVDGTQLDDLPFTSRFKGTVDFAGFRQHIQRVAAQGARATVTTPNAIGEWHETLRERHFDPDVYRYLLEANAAEGGMDKLFEKVKDAGAFVQYLLRFVGDDKRIVPIRDMLADNAAEIAKQPSYQAEHDFCEEAVPRLVAVAAAHDQVIQTAKLQAEARVRAAGYKRALLVVGQKAAAGEQLSTAAAVCLEDQRSERSRASDAARRHRDEYARLAALFRVEDATNALELAEGRVELATVEDGAWRAIPDLQALESAQGELAARRKTIADAAEGSADLQAAVDEARGHLAAILDAQIRQLDRELRQLAVSMKELDIAARAAAAAAKDADRQVTTLINERIRHQEALRRADTLRASAEDDGVLNRGEPFGSAVERIGGELHGAEEHLQGLERRLAELPERRSAAERARRDARAQERTADRIARDLKTEYESLVARAERLNGTARLGDLVQADDVDVALEHADVLRLLTAAVADADAAALDLAVQGAADERAMLALVEDGLLPPRPAVAEVVATLRAANTSAHPGWHYLAEHHPAEEHDRLISAHPALLDGVVVYTDPSNLVELLDGVQLDEAVVLGAASSFQRAAGDHVVLGPPAAQHDRAAAAGELDRRRDQVESRRHARARLRSQATGDRALMSSLQGFIDDLPADGLRGLRARAGAAQENADAAAAAEGHAADLVSRIEDETRDLHSAALVVTGSVGGLRRNLERAEGLAEADREVDAPARARLEEIPIELVVAKEQAAAKDRGASEALEALADAKERTKDLQRSRTPLRERRSVLGPAAATTPGASTEAAEARLAAAGEVLAQRFPQAELRRQVELAERHVQDATTRLDANSTESTRSRAANLLADPVAADPVLRASAAQAATRNLSAATKDQARCETENNEAQKDLADHTPSDRRTRFATDLPVEPADRAEALRGQAEAAGRAVLEQQRAGELERQVAEATAAAQAHRARSRMLNLLVDQLLVDPAENPAGEVPDDEEVLQERVRQEAAALGEAETQAQSALEERSVTLADLERWAGHDRFVAMADDEHGRFIRMMRERFRGGDAQEVVAPRANEFTAELRVRQRAILGQLDQVRLHRRNVVLRLAALVDDALSDLGRSSSLSLLPEEIGPWGGHRFLQVEARQRPNSEQAAARIEGLVDAMVRSGRIEKDPSELLWKAVDAAVTDGFKATILKPAPDQPTGRVPVSDMQKWSGGENLTTSIVLFIIMAKLRAEKRAGTKASGGGGLVVLDNPLGKANYVPFLELQRTVARACGAQLVFFTAIADIGAVTVFPRIAAMHKRPSLSQPGRSFVTVDDDASVRSEQCVEVVHGLDRG